MKIEHVTIQSANYEESVRFYQEIAGLMIQRSFSVNEMRITMLANSEGETSVEIIDAPGNAYSGHGISVSFAVGDVAEYRKKLEKKGYAPTPMVTPEPHTGFFFIDDPNGVQVQFIGRMHSN